MGRHVRKIILTWQYSNQHMRKILAFVLGYSMMLLLSVENTTTYKVFGLVDNLFFFRVVDNLLFTTFFKL